MPTPLVSIVTPVHNTAEYLADCIESVLAQTYSHWEYIIVNNQSTDGTREIAEHYAVLDPRIRLVDTECFLDQLPNFNYALRLISSESQYCKMVLADDYLFPECVERMVELAERAPTAGMICSYYVDGSKLKGVGLPYPTRVFPGREIGRMQLRDALFFCGSPTVPLFRSEVVRQRVPFFSVERFHADTAACYEVLRDWDFGFVHEILSYMRVDERSTTGRVMRFNPDLLDWMIMVHLYAPEYLDEGESVLERRRSWRRYRRYLGRSALRRPGPEFWEYHRRGLATIGKRIGRGKISLYTVGELLRLAGNPLETSRGVLRWWEARRKRSRLGDSADRARVPAPAREVGQVAP